ncbi:MAG TPA: hypothetical protein VEG33_22100 [Streptosporangiaceae bacterium]|nr:hypothetical protein [Streptosporangiaceae bacterium]
MRVAPGRSAGGASSLHAPSARHCWPASSGLLAAYVGSAAVTAVVALAGGTRHPAAALAAYGLLAAVVAASTRPAAAAGVALIAWMFDNGFIVGRHAELSWHGAADARRLAILLAAAAAAAMLGSHIRRFNQRLNPAPGQAIAVGADQGIPDGHPAPTARAPAAAPGHHRGHR